MIDINAERLERLPKILDNYPHLEIDLAEGTIEGKTFVPDKKGRRKAGMWLNNKMYNYFRYEIIAYLGGLEILDMTINHKNGIAWDDRLDNLETMSIAENLGHAKESGLTRKGSMHNLAKLTEEDVLSIKKRAEGIYGESKQLAKEYGVSDTTILNILKGRTWTHVENEVPPVYSDESIPWKGRSRVYHRHVKLGKPVVQKTLEGSIVKEWTSMSEAARQTGADLVGIGYCCKGLQKTSGGFKWEYVEENKRNEDE